MIYVTRRELAKMMGITPTRADVLLCPTAPKSELTREIIDLSEKHGGLPHIKGEAGKRGRRALLYPVDAFFPLCRWVDIKTLADTRPDVVGEYVAWVDKEAHELPLLWSGE